PELRVLGVFAPQRLPELPDVPTLGEQGYYDKWYGSARALVVPKGTPQEIVDFYVDAFRKTMEDPDCKAAHKKAGLALDFKDNRQLAALIAEQEIFCRDVVTQLYAK
ncbi:MAG: tripartite tricarboxylate transporter substrate binding protein, partial [Desulfovibrio sp.]|nr:tripartite tricarboxylate transporter substrate binding protein [Desulfovibrio sp.]